MKFEYKTLFVAWRGAGATLQNLEALDAQLNALGQERWRLDRMQEITIGLLLIFAREVAA